MAMYSYIYITVWVSRVIKMPTEDEMYVDRKLSKYEALFPGVNTMNITNGDNIISI